MKVHDSALRHGVVPEDAALAADWPLWVEPLDEEEWPHRELRLGFDPQARLLETVVLIFEFDALRSVAQGRLEESTLATQLLDALTPLMPGLCEALQN